MLSARFFPRVWRVSMLVKTCFDEQGLEQPLGALRGHPAEI